MTDTDRIQFFFRTYLSQFSDSINLLIVACAQLRHFLQSHGHSFSTRHVTFASTILFHISIFFILLLLKPRLSVRKDINGMLLLIYLHKFVSVFSATHNFPLMLLVLKLLKKKDNDTETDKRS